MATKRAGAVVKAKGSVEDKIKIFTDRAEGLGFTILRRNCKVPYNHIKVTASKGNKRILAVWVGDGRWDYQETRVSGARGGHKLRNLAEALRELEQN